MACDHRDCDQPEETALDWVELSEPLTYCEDHADHALELFPDLVDEVDRTEDLRTSASGTA